MVLFFFVPYHVPFFRVFFSLFDFGSTQEFPKKTRKRKIDIKPNKSNQIVNFIVSTKFSNWCFHVVFFFFFCWLVVALEKWFRRERISCWLLIFLFFFFSRARFCSGTYQLLPFVVAWIYLLAWFNNFNNNHYIQVSGFEFAALA